MVSKVSERYECDDCGKAQSVPYRQYPDGWVHAQVTNDIRRIGDVLDFCGWVCFAAWVQRQKESRVG